MDKPVAIITGAGRGIGRATVMELHRLDYRLLLAARSAAELEESARGLDEVLPFPADITRPDSAGHIVDAALDRFGRIDALVNCAGMVLQRSIEQTSVEDWHAVLDTNLSSVFYLCRAVWPVFRRQGQGVVVNLSSLACRDPFLHFSAYAAAKAGLNLLGLALAREGEPLGIRVHTIAPGAVETAMLRSFLSPEDYPPEKALDPSAIARLIAQCVQGDLQYSSGEVIFIHK